MISGKILVYLILMPFLDLTTIIQVLGSCSIDFLFHRFGVAIGVRDISSIQGTMRTKSFGVLTPSRGLVDITQQCSTGSHPSPIHDQHMIKQTSAFDFIICKALVNIPGAQIINVLNDVINGSTVQLKPQDACAKANPRPFQCMLTP
jgi:hypothetical protein